MNRFIFTTVIAELPIGYFGWIQNILPQFGNTRFDITGSRSPVTGEDIPPVSLHIDEQVFLTDLHDGIPNTRIAVRMVLHGMSDDIRHFVVATVVQLFHGVHNTTLHGFESVLNRRHRAL